MSRSGWLGVAMALLTAIAAERATAADGSPAQQAIDVLAREVPAWAKENGCYSCHNNGDGARALYFAHSKGLPVPEASLADTTVWLLKPEKWDQDLGDVEFKDGRLGRLQFAVTLAEAARAGKVLRKNDRGEPTESALKRAAARLAEDQAEDGSWPIATGGAVAGPTTYGTTLATHLASNVLSAADAEAYRSRLAKAQRWLEQRELASVLDAAAVLWALARIDTPAAANQRARAIELLRRAERPDGGWGPYVVSTPEPFDTAVVLLALVQVDDPSLAPLVARGRKFLIACQQSDGSWPATTRPAGGDSYAQYISTTAWCLQALLATE